MNGAENQNPAMQGDWVTRKKLAARAYHEWMPIRTPDADNLLKIYRRFDFGNIFTLHMLDTRIEGRDPPVRQFWRRRWRHQSLFGGPHAECGGTRPTRRGR